MQLIIELKHICDENAVLIGVLVVIAPQNIGAKFFYNGNFVKLLGSYSLSKKL